MSTNTEIKKTKGRHRFFQIKIHLGLKRLGKKVGNLFTSSDALLDILEANNFVKQLTLEAALASLEIPDRGRKIKLKDFCCQLEQDSNSGIPFWIIHTETSSLTSKPCIGRAISKYLFDTIGVDETVEISAISALEHKDKKGRLKLENSDWSPGFFSEKTIKLSQLLKSEEIKEYLRDSPNESGNLIRDLEN
jgi:hypothetical protein